jgi:hypothetical protein
VQIIANEKVWIVRFFHVPLQTKSTVRKNETDITDRTADDVQHWGFLTEKGKPESGDD